MRGADRLFVRDVTKVCNECIANLLQIFDAGSSYIPVGGWGAMVELPHTEKLLCRGDLIGVQPKLGNGALNLLSGFVPILRPASEPIRIPG